MDAPESLTVGGGTKKILYLLKTAQKIGVVRAGKALASHNACKACGLGMGGQRGGMVNELGEFPSVCNKSVQAQSTDIQPAIPREVLEHPLADFAELDGHEIEHLGRLADPVWKAAGDDRYTVVSWDFAMERAAARLAQTDPDRTMFYSSGRSSNEAGFVFQLLARAWGTNNVNNCSYYCHQATGVGLGTTIGTGTSTVELADLEKCDLFILIGANPASNHPRLIHKLRDCRARGGQVIVVNPAKEAGLVRFAVPKSARSMLKGGDEIASDYLQPIIGGDAALLKGLAKAIIERGAEARAFIDRHTEGFAAYRADVEATGWDQIETGCGIARTRIDEIAGRIAEAENAVFAWGMGVTHHLNGCDVVEAIACLALLTGHIGRPGAGLLPLRGHSNVQGIGTIGVKPVLTGEVVEAIERSFGIELPKERGYDTLAGIEAAQSGRLDAAVVMGGNLLEATPDRAFAREALERVGFRMYLTTTLNRGHVEGMEAGEVIVLPVTARDEEWEPTTQESMFNYVRMSDGGIERFETVRPEVSILADLAERLLPDSPIDWAGFASHRTIREAIARSVPGMEALADIDVARREFHITGRLLHEPRFRTDSGKARFVIRRLPPPRAPGLVLTTVRSEGQFNSIIYERTDSYRGNATRDTVMLHPDDIAAVGMREGDRANLVSDHGRMDGVTLKAYDIARGSVMAYFPEANVLVGTAVDPRSRTPSFKATPVRIEPA
ncbi:FdhF/YdeP family oxidoreductase [Tsuneonella sp. SYSU-LHT278]|uniref:FdhF/YdeP family oxidoreductase n=1 Tax=Tsuneonella sediminis TaxID=3416089 RepID=UPI003F792AF2